MGKINLLRQITLWRFLILSALYTLILILFQIITEANALNKKIIFLKDKFFELVWEPPTDGCHHYRIEVLKTDILAEPVTTSLFYEYTDSNKLEIELMDNHSYKFRVQAVTPYGAFSDYSTESPLYIVKNNKGKAHIKKQSTNETPAEFSLSQNYPNPFNGYTTIEYQIPELDMDENSGKVRLTIYNMIGQHVKELINDVQVPGKYSVIWDGRNDNGQEVANAQYIYQLAAGDLKVTKKMIFLK